MGDDRIGPGAPGGVAELHLSHNNLSARGLGNMFDSLRRRADECGGFKPPVWLRVEWNPDLDGDDIQELVQTHRRKGLRICLQAGMKDSGGCTIRICKQDCDVHLRLRDRDVPGNKGSKGAGKNKSAT